MTGTVTSPTLVPSVQRIISQALDELIYSKRPQCIVLTWVNNYVATDCYGEDNYLVEWVNSHIVTLHCTTTPLVAFAWGRCCSCHGDIVTIGVRVVVVKATCVRSWWWRYCRERRWQLSGLRNYSRLHQLIMICFKLCLKCLECNSILSGIEGTWLCPDYKE